MVARDNAKPAVLANEFLCCFQLRQPSGGASTTLRLEFSAAFKRQLRRFRMRLMISAERMNLISLIRNLRNTGN